MPRTSYPPDRLLDTHPDGVALIKRCEAFKPSWYLCPANVWTIGYGQTEDAAAGVTRQTVATLDEPEAARLLGRALVRTYEPIVETAVTVPLTAGEFSALVSFVYNVGGPAFRRSTLLRRLNAGDYEAAGRELLRWVYAGGKQLPGLVSRRRAELALFSDEALATWLPGLRPLPVLPVRPIPTRGLRERVGLPTR
jgi:lysozyme